MRKRAYSLKALRMREAIARQIYLLWHKLARQQAARRGADLRPPQVLDIEVLRMPTETEG